VTVQQESNIHYYHYDVEEEEDEEEVLDLAIHQDIISMMKMMWRVSASDMTYYSWEIDAHPASCMQPSYLLLLL